LQQADQRLYANKRSAQSRDGGDARNVLLRVLSENSLTLATHLDNVGRLSEAVAVKLGLSLEQVELTKLTAELHDIGKTAIPNAILDKPGPLDPDEWTYMKRHTIIGERILAASPALSAVAPLVRSTHENADGTGYPDGLSLHQIPLSSRIVAVVDAYDAMTSKRPYAIPIPPDKAIEELNRCAGSQFDPVVVGAFTAVWQEGCHGGEQTGATNIAALAS
jgi:HD-GYP domain-containing protein (c-di-GMP phosphodiesterase class II)